MEQLYVGIYEYGDYIIAPIESVIVLFTLKYIKSNTSVIAVTVTWTPSKSPGFKIPLSAFDNIQINVIGANELPAEVKNCLLPVICVQEKLFYVCGLCSILRRILKQTDCSAEISQKLLGFRGGCLTACAEVSMWTRFCELDLINATKMLISRGLVPTRELFTIPIDLLRFEFHLRQPVRVHNISKRRQDLVKTTKREKNKQRDNPTTSVVEKTDFLSKRYAAKTSCNPNGAEGCDETSSNNELPAWLRTKSEFVCLELSKTGDKTVEELVEHLSLTSDLPDSGEIGLDNKQRMLKLLTRDPLPHLQHKYAEGTDMTLADIILFPCIHQILISAEHHMNELQTQIPLILKWYKRMTMDLNIREAMSALNFKFDLVQKMKNSLVIVEDFKVLSDPAQYCNNRTFNVHHCSHSNSDSDGLSSYPKSSPGNFQFSPGADTAFGVTSPSGIPSHIPHIRNSKASGYKAKLLTKQDEIERVLNKVQEADIEVEYSFHPCVNVSLDWTALPEIVHPSYGELPTSRVVRKCQQLENLVSVILKIAKQGDIIVDFCSGGGHLGIVVAYLLPRCKIVMIDNKEESSVRAQQRVQALGLDNAILYQSNLDYFAGSFDIGTSLHACGVATDLVLQRCLDVGAAFVICPCCYGAVQNNHIMTYPRSETFKKVGINYKEYLILGHSADQTHINDPKTKQGIQCMGLIDSDRLFQARSFKYDSILCTLIPPSCTPKHNLLIGIPPIGRAVNSA